MGKEVNAWMESNLVVGLDIGTTKICAVVGEVSAGGVDIIGMGTHPSVGLRKGVVVNIESTVNSIKKAVEEAELMAGCEITSVYAGIAGGHIKGFNSHGVIAVKSREVTRGDIERVIEAAKAIAIPLDREVIHVLPQEFIVDDQDGIQDPLGMAGVRLEVKVHIITGAVTSAQKHHSLRQQGWIGRLRHCAGIRCLQRDGALTRRERTGSGFDRFRRRDHGSGHFFEYQYQTYRHFTLGGP